MNDIILISSDVAFRNQFKKQDYFIDHPEQQIVLDTADAANAINYLQEFPVDVVFLDMEVPVNKCLSLISSIVTLNSNIKVVMLGQTQNFELAMSGIRNGAFDYLTKPIDTLQLTAVFSRMQTLLLHHPDNTSAFTTNEYATMLNYLFQCDNRFFTFLQQLYCKAELNRRQKVYDIQVNFYNLFCHLYKDCKETYPFLSLYYTKDDLEQLSPSHPLDMVSLKNRIHVIAQELFYIISCFRPNSSSELIQSINTYVWEHVEEHISLEQLAEHFFVNKSYLSHLFKLEVGRTFMNYYTEVRMLRSRVLLKSNQKIYECAMALGYEDTEYFSKVFKNYYGCRPTEYMALPNNQAFHHIDLAVDLQ